MAARSKRDRNELRAFIDSLLKDKSCLTCPESHIACLDFHHKDPSTKEFKINEAPAMRCSRNRILREVAKCEILCSNCHRKKHWAESYGH